MSREHLFKITRVGGNHPVWKMFRAVRFNLRKMHEVTKKFSVVLEETARSHNPWSGAVVASETLGVSLQTNGLRQQL